MKRLYTKNGGFGVEIGFVSLAHRWSNYRIGKETNREVLFLPIPFVMVGYEEMMTTKITDPQSRIRAIHFKLGLFFWEIRLDVVISTGIYAKWKIDREKA